MIGKYNIKINNLHQIAIDLFRNRDTKPIGKLINKAIRYDNAKTLLDGPICVIGKSIRNIIRVIATKKGENISQLLLPKNFID